MWIRTNSNPRGREVGDCVVRALAEATGRSWRAVYLALVVSGCEDGNMPDANEVWGGYLRSLGWIRGAIPDTCPDCYTVADFAYEIEIPDNIPCWETEDGSYGVTIEGQEMLLSDVLTITGGKVAILYIDAKGLHKIALNTVED